jgi:adenylate cyclase
LAGGLAVRNIGRMLWLARHRLWVIAALCALCTSLAILGRHYPGVPFVFAPWKGEQQFHDLLREQGRSTPARDDFLFLGIDQQSLDLNAVSPEEIASERAFQLMTERPFPWSRELWALLLDKLFAAGARVVVFDMVFNPANDGDPAFAAALEQYRDRVVVGSNFAQTAESQLVVPNATLIPPPQSQDDRVGFVNFWPDATDGKLREVRFRVSERQLAHLPPFPGEEVYESIAARALRKFGFTDVPLDQEAKPFRYGPANAYQPKNLYEVFLPATWRGNFGDGSFFKGKLVMVGAAAEIMHDVVDTPLGPGTPGPSVHLHVMAAAMAKQFLTYPSIPLGYTLIGSAGVAAWMIVALTRRPLLALSMVIGLSILYLLTARFLYDTRGFFLLTVPVLSVFLASGLLSLGFEYWLERLEKLRTRRTLERYVSKNLVKEILDNPAGYYNSQKGARKPVTVLFSDLVGFTTLSERADPEELVRQLNEYLSAMVAVVFENEGTLDKFIGDAIMAVWGNVRSRGVADDTKAAARTALGMRRALKKLNDGWRAEGRMGLGMGIGINQGEALVGNIGSYAPHERLDPTVIGDAVNLGSRLEALTRTYGLDILVGASAAELIRNDFHLRSVARVQVKGKSVPVEVFTLVGAKGDTFEGDLLEWLEVYEEAIQKFRARDFTQAKILLGQYLEFYPNDYLGKMYLERALEYEQQPPDESWTAAEVFTKK